LSSFIISTAMDGMGDICIVCGTCLTTIGPSWLLPQLGLRDECAVIAAEVVSINGDNFDETLGIVSGALPPPNYKDGETIAHLREVMPGLCDWSGFERSGNSTLWVKRLCYTVTQ
jgi:hypothetical protein